MLKNPQVREETSTEAARTAGRTTTPTAINKAATAVPMTAHTEILKAVTDDLTTITEVASRPDTADRMTTPIAVRNKAVTVDPTTTHTETPEVATNGQAEETKVVMLDLTTDHIKAPRAVIDNPATLTGRIEATGVKSTTGRTKAPRAATDDGMTTPPTPDEAGMIDPRTGHTKTLRLRAVTESLRTPTGASVAVTPEQTTVTIIVLKTPTAAPAPVTEDRVMTLMGAVREATADPMITTSLALMARRSGAVVRTVAIRLVIFADALPFRIWGLRRRLCIWAER